MGVVQQKSRGQRTASNLPPGSIGLYTARNCDPHKESKDQDSGDFQSAEEHNPRHAGMVDESGGWLCLQGQCLVSEGPGVTAVLTTSWF